MKILLPTTATFDLCSHAVTRYDPHAPLADDSLDADVLVVWGNSQPWIRDAARRFRHLRLVQSLSSGSDAIRTAGFSPVTRIATGRSLHDLPVTEHALALTLAAVRRIHLCIRAQSNRTWRSDLGGIQPDRDTSHLSTLRDARILIWGFGSIGATLARVLTHLGAEVTGVATTARVHEGTNVVAASDVDGLLSTTDIVIMVLPPGVATHHALDERRLGLLSPRTWVVNVGRGSTIDEAALVRALAAGEIGGAALDVTESEPLPPTSPLWTLENVIITPHAAGGRPIGAARLVEENLRRLEAGEPLLNEFAPVS